MKARYALSACALVGSLLGAPVANAQSGNFLSHAHAGRTGTAHPHVVELRGGGAPANDECASAEALTVHTSEECTTMATAGDNSASTTSMGDPSCDAASAGYQDVWYSFNTGANELMGITLTNSDAMTDWAFVVMTACDATTDVGCFITPLGQQVIPLDANTDYIIRVYSNLDWGVGGAFTICVAGLGEVPDPPVNDECSGATVNPLAVGGSFIATGNTAGSTDSEGVGSPTTWEAFTLTECANVTVSFCDNAPALPTFYTSVVTGCPFEEVFDALVFSECGDGNTNLTMLFENLQPNTYYLPVRSILGQQGPYTVTISAASCPEPPANDECAGAVLIPADGSSCVTTNGSVVGATQSMEPLLCNGFTSSNAIDVWYSFVCATPDQVITVQGTGAFDAVVELLEGTCAGLTSIGCADATITDPAGAIEQIAQGGLVVGNTYYVRLYSYGNASPERDFTICVKSSPVGISEAVVPVQFSVFPNPTDGDFTLTYGDATGMVTLDLLDMAGRTVLSQQRTLAQGQNVALPLAGKLAPGAYSLRLTTATARSSQRLMVK